MTEENNNEVKSYEEHMADFSAQNKPVPETAVAQTEGVEPDGISREELPSGNEQNTGAEFANNGAEETDNTELADFSDVESLWSDIQDEPAVIEQPAADIEGTIEHIIEKYRERTESTAADDRTNYDEPGYQDDAPLTRREFLQLMEEKENERQFQFQEQQKLAENQRTLQEIQQKGMSVVDDYWKTFSSSLESKGINLKENPQLARVSELEYRNAYNQMAQEKKRQILVPDELKIVNKNHFEAMKNNHLDSSLFKSTVKPTVGGMQVDSTPSVNKGETTNQGLDDYLKRLDNGEVDPLEMMKHI